MLWLSVIVAVWAAISVTSALVMAVLAWMAVEQARSAQQVRHIITSAHPAALAKPARPSRANARNPQRKKAAPKRAA